MARTKSGHNQAIIDQGEVDIAESNKALSEGLKVIDQAEKAAADREFGLETAKRYLDGQEYDLARITDRIHDHIDHITLGFIQVGRLLLAVKAVEGHGKFTQWIEENFQFGQRTAQYFMFVAQKLERRPELASFAKGGVKKAVALLELPEDYHEEYLDQGVINGKPLDNYLHMTARELREEVKKLKNNQEKIIAEETKALKAENDALVKENKRLKKFEPVEEVTPEWCVEQAEKIKDAALTLTVLCRKMMIDERLHEDMPAQARIEQHLLFGVRALQDIMREWDETFNNHVDC